jgi:hypothetical protein
MLLGPHRRPPWTACVHFHDSYPVNVCFNFQFTLSVAVLGIYIYGSAELGVFPLDYANKLAGPMYWKNAGLKHNLGYVI